MKIECINGYYKFYLEQASDITFLETLFGVEMVKMDGFYTFEPLSRVGDFSIAGAVINAVPYTMTFSGSPSDVLFANKLALDLSTGFFVPFTSITATYELASNNKIFASRHLLQAYCRIVGSALPIKSFTAFYGFNSGIYSYDRLEFLQ
jgi:hypothetical protein